MQAPLVATAALLSAVSMAVVPAAHAAQEAFTLAEVGLLATAPVKTRHWGVNPPRLAQILEYFLLRSFMWRPTSNDVRPSSYGGFHCGSDLKGGWGGTGRYDPESVPPPPPQKSVHANQSGTWLKIAVAISRCGLNNFRVRALPGASNYPFQPCFGKKPPKCFLTSRPQMETVACAAFGRRSWRPLDTKMCTKADRLILTYLSSREGVGVPILEASATDREPGNLPHLLRDAV